MTFYNKIISVIPSAEYTNILKIDNLSIDFLSDGHTRNVVDNMSYTLLRGRTLGIVGESGSGKSVSSLAIMGLLPHNARITSGRIMYYQSQSAVAKGTHTSTDAAAIPPVDLLTLTEKELCAYRGRHISMVFQEPMTSLNPVQKCGAQVVEMLRMHESVSLPKAKRRVIALFEEVLLPRPEKIFDSYPHQISGGQKQRVMIAMALICNPDIVIADEPTTALDVTVQKTILDLFKQLQATHNIGVIFISHDLGVIAQIADDVAVVYNGKIVEQGTTAQILCNPHHPYTQGLLACRPPLEGRPQHLSTVSEFLDAAAQASAAPQPADAPLTESFDSLTASNSATVPSDSDTVSCLPEDPVKLMSVKDLEVIYTLKKGLFGKPKHQVKALDHVSFDIYKGETLGLVGESGCGKTTLGRTLLRLIDSASGSIEYQGISLDKLRPAQMRSLRPRLQIIFQDPYSSLNPRLTIGDAIMEPMKVWEGGWSAFSSSRRNRMKVRAQELMDQVGLDPDWFDRYPHEFSGGQRQRVCIARALILNPELVICDESVSALDVSVQAQVLNLLNDLKRKFGYTYLFISHDLSVVRFISDRIMVMRQGRIVESGPADEIYHNPQNEYTSNLIASIPTIKL